MEFVLGGVILALLGYIVYKDHVFAKERRELLNAVMSKTSIEFATANQITEKREVKEEKPSDIVNQELLTDEEFAKNIKTSIDEEEVKEEN